MMLPNLENLELDGNHAFGLIGSSLGAKAVSDG